MATTTVFRVEKNKNYTTISNHHLQDRNLSLKAKGLLTLILSLPPDWDMTLGNEQTEYRFGLMMMSMTISYTTWKGPVLPKKHTCGN